MQQLTDSAFSAGISDGLAVVDFWASWCAPCRAMAPQLELAAVRRPQYQFATVDVDVQPALAARFGISSIPTLVIFRDGEPIASHSGVLGADQLVNALARLVATGDQADISAADDELC